MTIASPRYCWNTLSISAVWIMLILPHTLGLCLAIEAVVFVAHEDSDRPLGLPGLFKGHRNPWCVGVFPPTASPAAVEKACPSRLTAIRCRDGSAFISRYSQLVSLSGSQTTWVTPFFFISCIT